jgi:aminoacrylate hydrolase
MGEAAGLYYEEHGPADAPPVILSPGLGGSASYWTHNLSAIAERHRVILYDHRGTGRSTRVLPPGLTVDDMADDLHRLVTALGVARAAIVGHAAGGAIGLALALKRPDSVGRLVVINGWSAPDPHFLRCFEARLALLHGSGARAFGGAQPLFLYPARWSSANHVHLEAEEAQQLADFQGVANLEARIAALAAFDIDERLGRVRAPTLLIAAEDDMLVPASCSERLAAGLPYATLATMSGGHACNVTEPARFNRILLDWLAGERLRGAA